jgi:hypothetical protein
MTQDLYYVDSGYLTPDAGYYVYTADAEAAVSSQATMAVTVGVIKDAVSTITCVSTAAAVISHIHGADLVAFSNAAIATEINVIRSTNVALTSVFSAAIDGSRGIYISAQADATATISIANSRVRFSEAAHSAAFALTADVSVIAGIIVKEAAADLSSAFTQSTLGGKRQRFEIAQVALSSQSTQAVRTRDINATIVSQSIIIAVAGIVKEFASSQNNLFTSTASASRTRDVIIAQLSAFTPTLIADAFKNSFAVLNSVSSLSAQAETIKVATLAISSQFIQVVVGGKDIRGTASLRAYSSLLASRNIARSRPVQLTNVNAGFDSTTKKYGSHSLSIPSGQVGVIFTNDNRDMDIPANTDFHIEFWMHVGGDTLAVPNNLLITGVGDMTALNTMNANDSWAIGIAGSHPTFPNSRLTFKFATASNTFTTIQTGQYGYVGGWNHIIVTRYGGNTILVFNNTSNDGATATYSGAIYQGTYKKLQLRNPFGYTASSATTNLLIDEFSFKIGYSGYSSGDAETSQVVNDPDTNVFLYHFNNSLADDVSVTFNQSAALSSIITASATISGPVRTTAALVSSSTLVAQVNKTAEINLVAFSNANVSTVGQRVRFSASVQSSASSLTVDSIRIQQASSAQASQFTQATTVAKTVNPPITTDAIFTELVAVAKTGAGFVQLDSVSTMAVSAVKTARITDVFTSQFTQTTIGVKSVETAGSISAIAALTANNTRIRNQVLVYAVNSQLEAVVGEIEQFSINLTAVSSLACETGGILQGYAVISSQASVAATILRIRDASSSLVSEFTQTTETNNSKRVGFASTQSAQTTVTASPGTIKTSAVNTDAIFTELAAVAKTGAGFITLDVQATQTAQAVKTANAVANINTVVSLSATATRIQPAAANLTTVATFTATGTFVTTASANISLVATLSCQVVKTVSAISLEASAGTLLATANATKRAAAALSVLAFELAVGSRTQRAQINIVSTSSVSAQIGGTFGFRSTMQGFAAEVVIADIIHIDAKLTWMIFAEDRDYSISAENRTYSIVEEDRDYMIVQENRTHAVTRELLTTELQGV